MTEGIRNQRRVSMAEINAWANYEVTAKQARRLIPQNDSKARNRGISRSLCIAYDGVEAVRPTHPKGSVSEYGTSWSKYFFKGSLDDAASVITYVEEPEWEISQEAQAAIKNLFGVYFEGGYQMEKETGKSSVSCCFWDHVSGTMPWLQKWVEEKAFFPNLLIFLELCLRGIGQVYFQNNPISGGLILIALLLQSTRVAIHGIIAVMSGNLLAYALRFDQGMIRSGLFGYNSVLVGLALATFDSSEKHRGWYAPIPIASIVIAAFSSVLFVSMGKLLVPYKSPPLTLPFNVATLMFLSASAQMSRVHTGPTVHPSLPDYSDNNVDTTITGQSFLAGVFRGVGQVFLVNEVALGVLVLAGVALCSRISALAAFAGSAIGAATALATGSESAMIEQGLYGFNASLTVTAMFMFYAPNLGSGIFAILAGLMTVIGQKALETLMTPFGLPPMTLPFCLISLPFIILQGTSTLVIPVPLAAMTIPEDHRRRVNLLKEGFSVFMEAIDSPRAVSMNLSRKSLNLISKISKVITAGSSSHTNEVSLSKSSRSTSKNYGNRNSIDGKNQDLIFDAMANGSPGHVNMSKFLSCLRFTGLDGERGLRFAASVFAQMVLDQNCSLGRSDFYILCTVSDAIRTIRLNISRFVDFVDMDNNGSVDFNEIDSALEYLGEENLSQQDRRALACMTEVAGEQGEIDNIELINFVTAAKIKALVKDFCDSKIIDLRVKLQM